MARLEPQLAKIRARYKTDPQRLAVETAELYRRHNVKVVDGRGLLGTLVRAPVFIALFSAVRRAWSGRSASLWITSHSQKPDLLMASACGVVTRPGRRAGTGDPLEPAAGRPSSCRPLPDRKIFLWRVAAGVAVYARFRAGRSRPVPAGPRYAARLPA